MQLHACTGPTRGHARPKGRHARGPAAIDGHKSANGQIWGQQQFGLNRLIWDPEHHGNGNNIISTYNLLLLDVTRQCNGLRNHFSTRIFDGV